MSTLSSFLSSHRTTESDWTLTGMSSTDKGRYKVTDEEYDTFLKLVNNHIFGPRPLASSLLERHRDVGPLLIDLDFRYPTGGPLHRRFTQDHVQRFIAEYVSAMIYFCELEHLPRDIRFYTMTKPAPESDKSHHKDGIHIQCPDIITTPKFQYAIRGYLLNHGTVGTVFGDTGISNTAEECYDVSVIHRNNWFLYGACKPDKAQYTVNKVWQISPSDIAESLDGGAPTNFNELVDVVYDMMAEDDVPTNTLDLIKTLSIRRQISNATIPPIRSIRIGEWEELLVTWGAGKARAEGISTTSVSRTVPTETDEEKLVIATMNAEREEQRRVTSDHSAEDIALAYRIARQCLKPEKRAAQYDDWVNLAICLRNISDTDESMRVWIELSRRAPGYDSRMTDADYRAKWNSFRLDDSKRLTMGSLIYWAREDAPETLKSIQSETNRDWIMNFAKDTHVNVASFVCRLYGHEFRCSVGAKRSGHEWFQFVGHSWKHLRTANELRSRLSSDVRNNYINADLEFGRRITLAGEAEKAVLEEKRKKIFLIERQLEMASFKDNILKECAEKFYDEEFLSKLNCNPYLVGVSNGVLDLRYYDNESSDAKPRVLFRPGRPDDNISFLMGRSEPDMEAIPYIPYDPKSQDQKDLMSFFEKIYPDEVLRRYVLTLLSSCLEGQNREQRFYVNQGRGSNGKSMTQTLMRYTFGDYQTSLQTTALTRKRPESGAANPDMIVTKCKRYIYMGEPDQNEKLNTARMKQLSGEDIVEARGLFSEQEKFKMMGKIFLSCNDLPPVSSMDNGTWRRLRVIPHVSTFVDPDKKASPEENIFHKDLRLEDKLRKWRTAFLSLLVHYYETEYLVNGLREPEAVLACSNKYKEENDTFHTFLSENFVLEPGAGPMKMTEVLEIYKDWKKTQFGKYELKPKEIKERMRDVCERKSTEKELWGIRRIEADEENDSVSTRSGRTYISNMP